MLSIRIAVVGGRWYRLFRPHAVLEMKGQEQHKCHMAETSHTIGKATYAGVVENTYRVRGVCGQTPFA